MVLPQQNLEQNNNTFDGKSNELVACVYTRNGFIVAEFADNLAGGEREQSQAAVLLLTWSERSVYECEERPQFSE